MLTYRLKTGGQVLLIPAEDIEPPEEYERTVISSEELRELADSIETIGMLNPVTVRSIGSGKYRIIAGERRRKAAELAGLEYIPSLLIQDDDEKYNIYSIAENLHRRDVHFLDTARRIEELREMYSLEEISGLLCIPEGMILSRIHLLSLPENIKWKIITGGIQEKDAVLISRITDINKRNEVTELMVSASMSFSEALETVNNSEKRTVFRARYKDMIIFTNTLDHAIKTMKASGIEADVQKTEDDRKIVYTVTINKMI